MNPLSSGPDGSVAKTPRISVCMATYNGAPYVCEQMNSILEQLGPSDEVVVVDDASTDDTVDRLHAIGDRRVRVLESAENRGYVRGFEESLRNAHGQFILLSDQDDVWEPGRVRAIVGALTHAEVVATNLGTLGGPNRISGPYGQSDWRLRERDSRRNLRNIVAILIGNRPYYGCAMGLRREALDRLLPFPSFLDESHDLWVALYGNVIRSVVHLDVRSVRRRFHGANATPERPRGPLQVARSRALLLRSVIELRRRTRR